MHLSLRRIVAPFHPAKWLLAIGVTFLVIILPYGVSERAKSLLVEALLLAYLGLCWNLVGGYCGQISVGHAAFLGIGAYVSGMLYLWLGLTPWIGMFAGALAATALGAGMAILCVRFRLGGWLFAVLTLVFAEVFRNLAINFNVLYASTGYLTIPPKNAPLEYLFSSRVPYYYVALGLLMMGIVVTRRIAGSRLGYYLIATRENEEAAECLGVPTARCKVSIMAISAAMTALGGTFMAQFYLFLDADFLFGAQNSFTMQIGPIIGGIGTAAGPVVGGIFMTILQELMTAVPIAETRSAPLTLMVYGVILMLTIIFAPRGLIGLKDTAVATFNKQVVARFSGASRVTTARGEVLETEL